MNKCDAVIGHYRAGTLKSKIRKQIKVAESTVAKSSATLEIVQLTDARTYFLQKATTNPFDRW